MRRAFRTRLWDHRVLVLICAWLRLLARRGELLHIFLVRGSTCLNLCLPAVFIFLSSIFHCFFVFFVVVVFFLWGGGGGHSDSVHFCTSSSCVYSCVP